eukprot:Rmarinus@m.23818
MGRNLLEPLKKSSNMYPDNRRCLHQIFFGPLLILGMLAPLLLALAVSHFFGTALFVSTWKMVPSLYTTRVAVTKAIPREQKLAANVEACSQRIMFSSSNTVKKFEKFR